MSGGGKRGALKYLWFAAVFAGVCLLMALRIDDWVDSDKASELVLAHMLNEEGRAVTENWFYSTELRVLNTQLVFAPLFSLFSSWRTVRVAGTIILFAIYAASYAFFCRQAGLWEIFPWTAPALFMPVSLAYFDTVLSGVYYIPHLSTAFFVLGLALRFARRGRRSALALIAGCAVSLAAGLGGLRQLLILYLPLCLTAFVLWARGAVPERTAETAEARAFSGRLLAASLAFAAAAGVGCALNLTVLAARYHFRVYDVRFAEFSLDRLEQLAVGLLSTLGFKARGGVFSSQLLTNGTCALLLLALAGALFYLLQARTFARLSPERRAVALFPATGLALFAALYLFTDMTYMETYDIPAVVSAVPAVGLLFLEAPARRGAKRVACAALSVAMAASGALYVSRATMPEETRELRGVAETLCAQGYRAGYGTFWQSNLLTEVTDGAIEMYTLGNGYEKVKSVDLAMQDHWLQPVSHSVAPPEGKVFAVLLQQQRQDYPWAAALEGADVLYESETFIVYGFDGYDEIKAREAACAAQAT